MSGEPVVLVMASAPRRGETRRGLEPVIGIDGCVALQTALLREALQWAQTLAPAAVYAAHSPPDAAPELRALLGPEVHLFPQNGEGIAGRFADAAGRLLARHGGPVLVVWPDLPRLRPAHGRGALEDLREGCDVVFGPMFDGGFYLIGLARPMPRLFALPERAWRSPEAGGLGLAAAREEGLEVGLLRAERGLHRPADVRAALADPMLPEVIARALGRH